MAVPKLEEAIGVVDGVNRTFFTTTPYVPNTVRLWLNGQLLTEDCLTEVDPSTGEVYLDTTKAPRAGAVPEVVQFLWIDAQSVLDELADAIEDISGCIEEEVSISGTLEDETVLSGSLEEEEISAQLESEVGLTAEVVDEVEIFGWLEECDE